MRYGRRVGGSIVWTGRIYRHKGCGLVCVLIFVIGYFCKALGWSIKFPAEVCGSKATQLVTIANPPDQIDRCGRNQLQLNDRNTDILLDWDSLVDSWFEVKRRYTARVLRRVWGSHRQAMPQVNVMLSRDHAGGTGASVYDLERPRNLVRQVASCVEVNQCLSLVNYHSTHLDFGPLIKNQRSSCGFDALNGSLSGLPTYQRVSGGNTRLPNRDSKTSPHVISLSMHGPELQASKASEEESKDDYQPLVDTGSQELVIQRRDTIALAVALCLPIVFFGVALISSGRRLVGWLLITFYYGFLVTSLALRCLSQFTWS